MTKKETRIARDLGSLAARIYDDSLSQSRRSSVSGGDEGAKSGLVRGFDERLLEHGLLEVLVADPTFRQALTGIYEGTRGSKFESVKSQQVMKNGTPRPDLTLSYANPTPTFIIEVKAWSGLTDAQTKKNYADLFVVPQLTVEKVRRELAPAQGSSAPATREGCVIGWEDALHLVEARSRSNELDWLASFADGILYGYTSMTKPFEVPINQLSDLWAYVDDACAWVDRDPSGGAGVFDFRDDQLGVHIRRAVVLVEPPMPAAVCGRQRAPDGFKYATEDDTTPPLWRPTPRASLGLTSPSTTRTANSTSRRALT